MSHSKTPRKTKFARAKSRANRPAKPGNIPSGSQYQALNNWLPFLDTYRTMCLAPQPDFRRVLAGVLAMELAA